MRKNLLLSSTAIVGAGVMLAMTSPARADIELTLSGQVEFGLTAADEATFDAGSNRGYAFFMDSETNILAEGATDSGINYSAKVELEVDADGQGDSAGANADEVVLSFWGGFGRVELGREDGAADVMNIGGEDFQAGTGGIDGDTRNLATTTNGVVESSDAAKVSYFTPRVAGFQAGVSYIPDTGDGENGSDTDPGDWENTFEAGLNWTAAISGFDVTLSGVTAQGDAEDPVTTADLESYAVGAGVEFAGFGVGVGYVIQNEFREGDIINVGAKYGFGPANVSVGYARDSRDDIALDSNIYVVSADLAVLPGVTLKGDVSYNDEDIDAGGDSTTAGVVSIQLDY